MDVAGRRSRGSTSSARAARSFGDEDRRARALRGRSRRGGRVGFRRRGTRDEALLGGRAVGEERRGGDSARHREGGRARPTRSRARTPPRRRRGGERGDERQDAGGGHAGAGTTESSSRRGRRHCDADEDFFFSSLTGEPNDPSLFRVLTSCRDSSGELRARLLTRRACPFSPSSAIIAATVDARPRHARPPPRSPSPPRASLARCSPPSTAAPRARPGSSASASEAPAPPVRRHFSTSKSIRVVPRARAATPRPGAKPSFGTASSRARSTRARRPRAPGRSARRSREPGSRRPAALARAAPTAPDARAEKTPSRREAPGADARKNGQSRRSGDADLLTSDGQRAATCTNAAPFGERNDFKNHSQRHRKHPNALPWSASVTPHPTHPRPHPSIATESHLRAHLDHMVKGFERESRLRVPRGQMRDVVRRPPEPTSACARPPRRRRSRPAPADAAAGRRLGRLPASRTRERERPGRDGDDDADGGSERTRTRRRRTNARAKNAGDPRPALPRRRRRHARPRLERVGDSRAVRPGARGAAFARDARREDAGPARGDERSTRASAKAEKPRATRSRCPPPPRRTIAARTTTRSASRARV